MNQKQLLVEKLIQANCIKIGKFTLKNGSTSKYYFDMKNLISTPALLAEIGDLIFKMLGDFDIITGIPYGGLPIATYISTKYNKPMIILRDSKKKYGTGKLIEGEYKKTDKCVLIDDVITSGGSLVEAHKILSEYVTIVETITIFDRQQHENPIEYKSLLCKNDVIRFKLQNISNQKKSKLCFSADIDDLDKLSTILENVGKYIVICKIHSDIYSDPNLAKKIILEASIKHDFLIMEDRKFNDISYIVYKQYFHFSNWVDLVTVHSLVSPETIQLLSGAMIVANMSNNDYDFSKKAQELAKHNKNNVLGYITQKRIDNEFIHMTPGIGLQNSSNKDQQYKTVDQIDTDYVIMGRAIYNSKIEQVYKHLNENGVIKS